MPTRKSVRLLVVDEHAGFCELIRQSAEIWNSNYEYECVFADSAQEGLRLVKDWSPTIVVVDAYIPDMSCKEFIDHCKEGHTPLIVTSENTTGTIQDSARAWGADAYFPKSLDPDELDAMLVRVAELAADPEATH